MRSHGLTRVEVIVIVCAAGGVLLIMIAAVAVFGLANVSRAREEARKANCKENLSQIGKAIYAYTQNYGEYFPFTWGPANGACSMAPGSTDSCDAATSLACLYPQFLSTPRVFRCPSTTDQPSFVVNAPQGVLSQSAQGYLWSLRNWTLKGNQPGRTSSYGYDPRIYPSAVSNMAIMADWDGSWQANHKTSTQNHAQGQNTLYVDGGVKFMGTNYCSNDPIDNIFTEGGVGEMGRGTDYWNADTDAYLVNGSVVLKLSYNEYEKLQQ